MIPIKLVGAVAKSALRPNTAPAPQEGISGAAGAALRYLQPGALNLAANSTLTLDISSALEVGGAFGAGTFNLTLNGLEGITDAGEYTLISAASGLDAARLSGRGRGRYSPLAAAGPGRA